MSCSAGCGMAVGKRIGVDATRLVYHPSVEQEIQLFESGGGEYHGDVVQALVPVL